MATLINGNGNYPVTAQQDADLYQGILGGEYVKMLPVGSEMAYTIVDANTITIADGECVDSEGRRIHIDVGYSDTFTIPTGTSGQTAYYIIGYLLSEDSDGNETADTFVEEVETATTVIEEASLRDGATSKYVSLYRITQESLTITNVDKLFIDSTALANISEVIESTLPFALAIDDDGNYGYITKAGVFMSFRQPTGTATAAQVVSGYTFSNASEDGLSGSMTNNGAVSEELDCGESYTVPEGYHNGSGVVTANSLSSQTSGTATAAYILSGYTAWVDGSQLTGSMTNRGTWTSTPTTSTTVTIPEGYHNGSGYVNTATVYTNGQSAGKSAMLTTLSGYTWSVYGTAYMTGWTSYGGVQQAQITGSTGSVTVSDGYIYIYLSGGGNDSYILNCSLRGS